LGVEGHRGVVRRERQDLLAGRPEHGGVKGFLSGKGFDNSEIITWDDVQGG